MDLPSTKNPGDRIYAADFNALSAAARTLPVLTGGSGISVSRGAAGVVVSAGAGLLPCVLEGIVEEVQGSDGDYVETVTYTVRPRGTEGDDALIEQRLPIYNRPFAGVKLKRTARVGELCFIVRLPTDPPGSFTDDLWMVTEQIDTVTCGQGARRPLPEDPLKKRKGKSLLGLDDAGAAGTATNTPVST